MSCDRTLLTQAYLDGELDPAGALDAESHISGCAECQSLVAGNAALREALRSVPRRHPAPPALQARILQALDQADEWADATSPPFTGVRRVFAAQRQRLQGALAGLAVGAAIAAAVILTITAGEPDDDLVQDLATAHVRSLMGEHLVDIAGADQAKIKPWFDGKVEVSPPVLDFAQQGFTLVGGRADFVDSRRVAALVYKHDSHVVNLFVWPIYEASPPRAADRAGYHMWIWDRGDFVFCAVSDEPTDPKALAKLVNTQIPPAKPKS